MAELAVKAAAEALAKLVRERLGRDGFPWYGYDDVDAALTRSEKGAAVKIAERLSGVELLGRSGTDRATMERCITLANLFKQQGTGEVTDVVRDLFMSRFPDTPGGRISGPTARRARELAGLESPKKNGSAHAAADAAIPSEFREALNMAAHIERLQKTVAGIEVQIEDLERRRAEVQKEIDLYKPAIQQMKALSTTVQTIKSRIGEKV